MQPKQREGESVGDCPGTVGGDTACPVSPHHSSSLFCPNQEVDASEIQVQVCLYAFDLIYLNGEVSFTLWLGQPRAGGEVGVGVGLEGGFHC